MEPDIEMILEEKIIALGRHIKSYEESNCRTAVYQELVKEKQAISNVLSRLKQLEEENKRLKELDISNNTLIANMSERHFHDREKIRNSIPKSKVKEKIEWLTINILDNEYASDNDKDIAEYQVNVLEELLGEE